MYIFINCNIADKNCKNCKKKNFLDFEKRYYYNASLYDFILNIKLWARDFLLITP